MTKIEPIVRPLLRPGPVPIGRASAIVQSGHAIFGIGPTLEAAYKDAEEWTEDMPPLAELPSTADLDGDMHWARVTAALAAEVGRIGGNLAWGELPDGTLCLPSEEP